jgi:hypothetical protein
MEVPVNGEELAAEKAKLEKRLGREHNNAHRQIVG